VLFNPAEFFQEMAVSGGMGSPLAYGVIVAWIGAFFGAVYSLLPNPMLGALRGMEGLGGHSGAASMVGGVFFLVMYLIFAPVGAVIGIFLGAGITHLCLMALGGAKEGFEATFRVVCYEQAVQLVQIVPFCGGLIAFPWMIVVLTIGLQNAHKIGVGTALAAVLIPIVLICCCCAGLIFAFAGSMGALIQQMQHAR
jgi:hypothetical protein